MVTTQQSSLCNADPNGTGDQLIEMHWPVMGDRLPADHNYRLYSALVERQPDLKQIDWQLNTINGVSDHKAWIKLGRKSKLMIRCSIKHLSLFELDHQIIRVGQSFIEFGEGEGKSIYPCEDLLSRLTTIKSTDKCWDSEFKFGVALGKQLAVLGVDAMPNIGDRKTLKIQESMVVGYSIYFEKLKPNDSMLLQQHGIGGRRKMGGGVFVCP